MSIFTDNCIFSISRANDGKMIVHLCKRSTNAVIPPSSDYAPFSLSGIRKTLSFEMMIDWKAFRDGSDTVILNQGNSLLDSILSISIATRCEEDGMHARIHGSAFYEDPAQEIISLPIDSGWMIPQENMPVLVQLSPELGVSRVFTKAGLAGEARLNAIPSEDHQMKRPILSTFRGNNIFIAPEVKSLSIYDISIAPQFI